MLTWFNRIQEFHTTSIDDTHLYNFAIAGLSLGFRDLSKSKIALVRCQDNKPRTRISQQITNLSILKTLSGICNGEREVMV